MNAMLFAAGLGTRLRPLTNDKPKALVEINGQTLLQRNIIRLRDAGFDHIVVNVHHFASQVIQYLNDNNGFGADITISDESNLLLDTGGGLKKACKFFQVGQPILIHNVDILSNIDLLAFYNYHQHHQALATLAVRNRKSSRVLLFDDDDLLRGWRNNSTGELKLPLAESDPEKLQPLAFSGIQVINYELLNLITETGKFSMIDVYLRLSAGWPVKAFRHNEDYWTDVGKIEELKAAEKVLKSNE
ncbi:MAG: nucleotidyltransferase family protein [Bacteroidota bacterium]|nr:nucleotidyltransferase family protein [Bacteroidota bacterium]